MAAKPRCRARSSRTPENRHAHGATRNGRICAPVCRRSLIDRARACAQASVYPLTSRWPGDPMRSFLFAFVLLVGGASLAHATPPPAPLVTVGANDIEQLQ